MTTNQTIDGVPCEQMACMPVERCYDVRVKMIIAFNEAKKAGGDLDDALDAAYKSALRYSPNPMNAEQPAPVAVVLPELDESAIDDLAGSSCQEALAFGVHQDVFARLARTVHKRTLDEVTRLNPSL